MSDFLFLDLETTGLDPKRCAIIEVACVLTKDDFVPYARFESLVHKGPKGRWEEGARKMHEASGLRKLSSKSVHKNIDYRLEEFLLRSLRGDRANLAGNSVHFDRAFLAEHWPGVFDHLTHRQLDVSSLRLLGEARGLPKYEAGEKAHRAMADVENSLRELRYWTGALAGVLPDRIAVANQGPVEG